MSAVLSRFPQKPLLKLLVWADIHVAIAMNINVWKDLNFISISLSYHPGMTGITLD
jgi:hypothetical protein